MSRLALVLMAALATSACTRSTDKPARAEQQHAVATEPAPADSQLPLPDSAFKEVFTHYEGVRALLADDKTEGVATHARELAAAADAFAASFAPSLAAVPAEKAETVQGLLPGIATAARKVADAPDIATQRTAFWELSQPLIQWRNLVDGPRPAVAYCPMADKSWLQAQATISNPYYGHEMLTCGNFVKS